MSRIGKQPISIPGGVTVVHDAQARTVGVTGPKGSLDFTYRPEVAVSVDEGAACVTCSLAGGDHSPRQARALWGTTRARIRNMVVGVTEGYVRKLRIVGVGWNAKAVGPTLQLQIGFCHPVKLTPPKHVEFSMEGNTDITISGIDKQAVGQFAAEVRSKRPPEPYNGKGILYEGETIIRKQGKIFGA